MKTVQKALIKQDTEANEGTRCPCVIAFEVEPGQELLLHSKHPQNNQSLSNQSIFLSDLQNGKKIETRQSIELPTMEYVPNSSIWEWLQTIISQSSLTSISPSTMLSSTESVDNNDNNDNNDKLSNYLSLPPSSEQSIVSTDDELSNIPYYRLLIKTNEWIYQEEMASALIYEVPNHFFKSI